MNHESRLIITEEIISAIETLIPEYMKNPADEKISDGNVAVCIVDADGRIAGKIWGGNKSRGRQSFRVAWTKASQVWLTGVRTGEYERLVFTGVIPENANGIENPDLIGWEGGQPVTLRDGSVFSVGFSGFRGVTDLEIVMRAINLKQL